MKVTTGWMLALGVSAWFWAQAASALVFSLPPAGSSVVGQVYTVDAKNGQTLSMIGRDNDIGFYEMAQANPGVNPSNVGWRRSVTIPAQFILPPGPRSGIVINLAQLRLFYYPKGSNEVVTMPVGIGRQGWQTPKTTTSIIQKTKNPTWRPTANIRNYQAENGIYLPEVVPAGPENPLGDYAMRLAMGDYLIHGTDQPYRVGERASAGCIRMFPEDIESLFEQVPVGTKVRIIDAPYSVGWRGGDLYVQAQVPLAEYRAHHGSNLAGPIKATVSQMAAAKGARVDWEAVAEAAQAQTGIPTVVATRSSANYAVNE